MTEFTILKDTSRDNLLGGTIKSLAISI